MSIFLIILNLRLKSNRHTLNFHQNLQTVFILLIKINHILKIKLLPKFIMYNFFKKKDPHTKSNQNQLHDYHQIKNQLEIPLKIKLFLEMLENIIDEKSQKKKIPKQMTDIYKQFNKCFSKLPPQQKQYFLIGMIKIVESILKQKTSKNVKNNLQYEGKIDKIQTSCQVRQFFVGVSKWEQRIFKFFNLEKIIKVCSHKTANKQIVFPLNQYHLRLSNKQKNTIVLQAIFDTWNINQKHHSCYIHFKNQTLFNQVYSIVKNATIMTWKTRLVGMLNQTEDKKIQNMGASENTATVGVRMLTSKTISDYFKTKQVINKLMNKNIKWKQFSEIRKIRIYRSKLYQNLYKTENVIERSFDNVVSNIELVNRKPTKKLLHYEKMETFSNSISAVYYKYMVKGCTHQMLCIVDQIQKQNEVKVIYKAIDNYAMEKNVDFVQIKVQRIGAGKTKVSAVGFVNFDENKKLNPVSVVDFFLSIVQYQQQKQQDQSTVLRSTAKYESTYQVQSTKIYEQGRQQHDINDDEDDFVTVAGDNFNSDEQRQLQICNTFESPKKGYNDNIEDDLDEGVSVHQRNVINEFKTVEFQQISIKKQPSTHIINPSIIFQTYYLKKKQPKQPQPVKQKKQLIQQHYFVGQWANYEKGGLYSLNTKMIDKQKKVYQSFLSRVGKALMSKKLSNISIPVIALRDESMLESIARNLSYAPILLEKLQLQSPIQRMKKTIVFMISMGTIGLSYAKPFNPILGETFQASIDNCPVYLQQTSHHPPISTLYFKGRGYQVYGSVNPSISLRLNSVKGFSETDWYVKFQNGDQILFRHAKMQIGGLLVGDRTFDFCDTTYLIDEKNKIITELTFGPKKKFGKQMKGDKTDFLWGHVYKVTDNFMTRFLKEGKTISPSTQKNNKVESSVYGCWHEKIFIDEKLEYDFRQQLPCKMVYQNHTLRSDSRLRMDIAYLSQEKYAQAQDEKDRLQDLQRHDAKIRIRPQKQ